MFSRFPYRLYNAALVAGAPLLLPYYGFRAARHGKYLPGLKERFGFLPESLAPDAEKRPTIWFHCVSVGEVLAARPLALALREALPEARFVVSTTTETGQARAREQLAWMDGWFYFPLDLPGVAERAVRHVRPSLVVVMETEIWANFLRVCTRKEIPVVLANGRISDRSFPRYKKLGGAMADLLGRFTKLLMQSDGDAERIVALGAPPDRVIMIGNLKYAAPDADERARQDRIAADLAARFNLPESSSFILHPSSFPLIVAGSTVEGEEPLVLEAFAVIRATPGLENTRMLLAPRHPQRFDEVKKILDGSAFQYAVRTNPGTADATAPVILLDTVGELAAAYRFGDAVFVGGSLVPRGGHSILEPAAVARPVVTGPHTENFRDILKTFRAAEAVRQLETGTSAELAKVLTEILTDPDTAARLGERAFQTFTAQTGAAARAREEIVALLGQGQ